MLRDRILIAIVIHALLAQSCRKSDSDCDSSDSSSCEAADEASAGTSDGRPTPLSQDLAPLPGEGPTFSDISKNGYTVSWTAATDAGTEASKLQYSLVSAAAESDLDSLAEAKAIRDSGSEVDWATAVFSKTFSGLAPSLTKAYAVLVRDEAGNIALYPAQEVTTDAVDAPAAGTALVFSDVTESGYQVSWGAGTSPFTSQENLEYRVVTAASTAAIDTVAEASALSGASVLSDWTKNLLSYTASGLSGNTNYALAVLVRSAEGSMALYTPAIVTTAHYRLIFMTAAKYPTGQLTPTSNADSLCNLERPAGRGTFKALIASGDRFACTSNNCSSSGAAENQDWVMEANRTYENKNAQILWTTNAAGIVVLNGAHPAIDANSLEFVWTGFDDGWMTSDNCFDWTTASGADIGRIGASESTDVGTWSKFNYACEEVAPIYCVEQ